MVVLDTFGVILGKNRDRIDYRLPVDNGVQKTKSVILR
jgi:hypothetical protein